MKKVVVVGGSGFIGSHVADRSVVLAHARRGVRGRMARRQDLQGRHAHDRKAADAPGASALGAGGLKANYCFSSGRTERSNPCSWRSSKLRALVTASS